MNIGIVLSQIPAYSETFFNLKIKGLKSQGYRVILFIQQENISFKQCEVISAPSVSKKVLIQLFKSFYIFMNLVFYMRRVLKFVSLEKKSGRSFIQVLKNIYNNSHILKADLDWLHFGFSTLAIGSEHVAKSIGAKMAVSCRGYDMDVYPLKHPNCYELVWKYVDKVHAISEYMLQKAYDNGLAKSIPTRIIYPAVDENLFQTMNTGESDGNRPIKMMTIARLHWIKGLNYTLEALSILKSKGVNFDYQIIGDGPEYEYLRYVLYDLDLEDCVTFLGKSPHKETLSYLINTDIYLQYSESEGFCNAVLEAQAMGCLCIVSDGGGLPENILHGKTGFVAPKRNSKALADMISWVLQQNRLELNKIKQNARRRVLEEFTIKKQCQHFIDFYE